MGNFIVLADEVILYDGKVKNKADGESFALTLTSQKMVLEKEKGLLKKELELAHIIELEKIKFYNNEPQIKQKNNAVDIQSIELNITLEFSGMIEARKFTGKAIDAVTGTTLAKRNSERIKGALDLVDDTLSVDSRGTIKGVFEGGIKGMLLNGIGKKKK